MSTRRGSAGARSATGAASVAAPGRGAEYAMVSRVLIDEPELAARSTFDEQKLLELAESIKEMGIIEPLIVERQGARYRIVAGHRRYIAATMVALLDLPCLVYEAGRADVEAVKEHENAEREDLNALDQARHFARLLEGRCGGDVDSLCRLVRRRREYVEGRLLLLRGDESVLEALGQGKISMAVAHELNREKDQGIRRMWLDAALKGGATSAMVRQWRIDRERMLALIAPAGESAGSAGSTGSDGAAEVQPFVLACFWCGDQDEPHAMQLVYVHTRCRKIMERREGGA